MTGHHLSASIEVEVGCCSQRVPCSWFLPHFLLRSQDKICSLQHSAAYLQFDFLPHVNLESGSFGAYTAPRKGRRHCDLTYSFELQCYKGEWSPVTSPATCPMNAATGCHRPWALPPLPARCSHVNGPVTCVGSRAGTDAMLVNLA